MAPFPTPVHPIVTAAQIDAARVPRRHWLNTDSVRLSTCMSDMAGMAKTNVGVHHSRVEPGGETTEMHHHINEAEWMYILKGSATVKLTLASFEDNGAITAGLVPALPHKAPEESYTVGPGDFMGFPGGIGDNYAHTMVAGPEGVEYLVGGTRNALDMCTYPNKETTLLVTGKGQRAIMDSKSLKFPPVGL